MKEMDTPDHTLLERYRTKGHEPSFKELVNRHLGLVHGTALRITKDHALAEDVSQIVFTKLARLGKPLPADLLLVSWLHRVARLSAIDLLRSEVRRRDRERNARLLDMTEPSLPEESISPALDEVIDQLAQDDRQVVLCRFFQGKSHGEIGRTLGLSENAVRMRIHRALEKVRLLLQKRGITTTAAALATALPAYASPSAPKGLAAIVAAKALASSAPPIATLTIGIIHMSNKAIIACAVLLLAIAGSAIHLINADKPGAGPDRQPSTNSLAARPGQHRDPSGRAGRPGGMRNAGVAEATEDSADAKRAFETLISGVAGEKRDLLEKRIQQLVKKLNLTDAQRKDLSAWLDGRLAEIEELDFSDENANARSRVADLGRRLTPAALDEHLASSLAKEQQTALANFKQHEHQNQVDSIALRKLSRLQTIVGGLDENQRAAVYDILSKNAEAAVSNGVIADDNEVLASDPFESRVDTALAAAATRLRTGEDPAQIEMELLKSLDQIADERVSQFRSILSDEQLAAYRDRLTDGYRDAASFLPFNRQ